MESKMPKVSLTDKAYSQIKEWIIGFDLKPGTHLSIQDLAEALGISRTPVREALSRLEQEFLVVRSPMKGFAVKSVELHEIEDLFEVRTAIELLAVKQAAKRITPEKCRQIAESLETTAVWISKEEKSRCLKLEQNFHMKILEASGNIALEEIGRGVLERIWAIQHLNIITSDALTLAHQHHTAILRALEEGNPRQAEAAMRNHMQHTTRELIARLRNRDDIIHNAIAFNLKRWQSNQ
jgi:DNA-binding GntR family transcriptional regulator